MNFRHVSTTTSFSNLLVQAVGICLLCTTVTSFAARNEELDRARAAAKHGEWELVAELTSQVVSKDANNDEAWTLLGDAQLALGDTAGAMRNYETALSHNARQPDAVLSYTFLLLDKRGIEDAEQVVAAAEAKDKKGKFDEIKVARGLIFARQGNMAEATKILASATAKNPENPLYPQILARIYDSKNVTDLAANYYAEAWKLDPGNPVIAFEYGVVLQKQKKYDEALNLFKEVQIKDPGNKSVDYLIGRLYFAAGRYAEASKQFELAVEKRPDHFLSVYLLGRSYLELSKAERLNLWAQATKHLQRALDLKPEREDVAAALAEGLYMRGRSYFLLANVDSLRKPELYDSSLLFLRRALAFNLEIPGLLGQLSRTFDKRDMLDSALFYLQQHLAAHPEDQGEFPRVINLLQRTNNQRGLIDELAPLMDDTTALARYGLILANAQIETANYGDARETIRKVIKLDPGHCDAHQLNAYIDLKRERYAEAVPALQAGVRACPRDANLWLYLGDCLYFSDPKNKEVVKQAQNAYQKACELHNPDGCEKRDQVEALVRTLR